MFFLVKYLYHPFHDHLVSIHAVQNNDLARTERWLKSWARVNIYHGDRKLVEVARALGHKEVVKLLEAYSHINEFVCTTFACDLKAMMQLLSLGKGELGD